MQDSVIEFLSNNQEIISALGGEVIELEIDKDKIEQEKQNFFQRSVRLGIQKKLCSFVQAIDKTSLWEMVESKNSLPKQRKKLLGLDGICKGHGKSFSIKREFTETPFKFICQIGEDHVLEGDFVFIEIPLSDDPIKIRKNIEKYTKIFEKYTLKVDNDLIFPNRTHLILVLDYSLTHPQESNLKAIQKELREISLLFKSITIFYCRFIDILETWANEDPTLNPLDIFAYMDKRFGGLFSLLDGMRERLKKRDNLFTNRAPKNEIDRWEPRTFKKTHTS